MTLTAYDALIGTWATTATHPEIEGTAHGRTTFEWLPGDHFLIQRAHTDDERFPDFIAVIGPPETGDQELLEYFDSRGVRRTYNISLADGELRIWREAAGFDQRFAATLDDDEFTGLWQLATTPGDWHDDVAMSYRRILETPS